MPAIEKARVFMSGRSQAVRIPARYRFHSEEVFVRHDPRTGDLTLSERPQPRPLSEIYAALDEAFAAQGPLALDRDERPAEERDWM